MFFAGSAGVSPAGFFVSLENFFDGGAGRETLKRQVMSLIESADIEVGQMPFRMISLVYVFRWERGRLARKFLCFAGKIF